MPFPRPQHFCEAAAYYKEKGMTLWDAMVEMYEKYGYYKDEVKSIGLKGIEGLAKIQEIMEYFRAHTPSDFAGHKVLAVRDYKADTVKDLASGEGKTDRTSILQCSLLRTGRQRMALRPPVPNRAEDQVLLRRERYLPWKTRQRNQREGRRVCDGDCQWTAVEK